MDRIDSALGELRKALVEHPTTKEYLRLKDLYENDPFLVKTRKRICLLRKDESLNHYEIDALVKEMESYPLSIDYHETEGEFLSLLEQVTDILS